MNASLANMRTTYERAALGDQAVLADPFAQFAVWFAEARASSVIEANAMNVATVDADGRPSARTVLLKAYDEEGFVFFTNYESRKGHDLAQNPNVALTFYWAALERQVRITGVASRISASESDAYFDSRPEGSRIGAIASPQSAEIPDRTWLEERVATVRAEFAAGSALVRPAGWGGYRVHPDTIEFWQGRPNRLHDRIVFTRVEDGNWKHIRLAP